MLQPCDAQWQVSNARRRQHRAADGRRAGTVPHGANAARPSSGGGQGGCAAEGRGAAADRGSSRHRRVTGAINATPETDQRRIAVFCVRIGADQQRINPRGWGGLGYHPLG